jgi:phosphoenolpyruvate carboxykinase (GTP)
LGITPRYEDLTWDGLDFDADFYERITTIDASAWEKELTLHAELFERLSHRLPQALPDLHSQLKERLQA